MTLSTTLNRSSTAGDGVVTVFTFSPKFFANNDLTVILVTDSTGVETTQTITTHYTVAGAGNSNGGTVTMLTAPAVGETLVIIRAEQFTQGLDLVENDPFPSDLVEQQLDILTMLTQQNNTEITRSLRQADGDTANIARLPVKVTRATKVLGFDSDGDPVASTLTVAAMESGAIDAAASATAAATSETNAATSETNAATSATNAATSATNAATSETNAATSETNAAASASAAASSAAGIYWKVPVVVATTANITLSGEQTIDGVLTSASRVLVKDQTAPAENGVYVSAAGAWSRATPLDTWDEHVGAAVIVSQGSTHADDGWICTVDAGGTLETTAVTWAQMTAVVATATATSEGKVELATQAEVDAGTDANRVITPATLAGASGVIDPAHIAGSVNAQTDTTYTFVIGDAFKTVTLDNASAIAVTIPTNASVAFPTGARIDCIMLGAGTPTITGDTGVTVNGVSAGGATIEAQYSGVSLLKIGTNTWVMFGNHGEVA